MNKKKTDKKVVLVVAGITDTLCSSNSRKKIRNNEELVSKVKNVIKRVNDSNYTALVNFSYPSDPMKDVNVFEDYPETRVVNIKIHSNSFIRKDNEIAIMDHDGNELLFNGDDFSFLFRPEEYDVYLCGIDLNGIFTNTIKELLDQGYSVKAFSDCLSALSRTRDYINTLQRNKNFEFCSYKSL